MVTGSSRWLNTSRVACESVYIRSRVKSTRRKWRNPRMLRSTRDPTTARTKRVREVRMTLLPHGGKGSSGEQQGGSRQRPVEEQIAGVQDAAGNVLEVVVHREVLHHHCQLLWEQRRELI